MYALAWLAEEENFRRANGRLIPAAVDLVDGIDLCDVEAVLQRERIQALESDI